MWNKISLFSIDPTKCKEITAFFYDHYQDSLNKIVANADNICEHVFNFLGLDNQKIGEKINWHKDYKSGYEWDNKLFYKKIKYGYWHTCDADVIGAWELSRFQHLPILGEAFFLTTNRKYIQEFVNQVTDWIISNPVNYGVNWVSPMEVGIRTVNWIVAFQFFCRSELISEDYITKFLESLSSHADYLMKNVKKTPNNNHRIAGFVGLLYLGLFLSESKKSTKCISYALSGLLKCMQEQVYADGVDYEGSIYYHKFVTELFLSAVVLGKYNNIHFPSCFLLKLEKMLEFISATTFSNGNAAKIGDDADCRLLILSDYYTWNRSDPRYLLSVGAVIFDRADFAYASGKFQEETFWILGIEGYQKFSSLANTKSDFESLSKAYQNGGYYIMKNKDLCLMVDCLPFDKKAPTGHRHNSRLSFEMYAYGKNLITDPGTYVYTSSPEWRNKFRSTAYHNTAVVDEVEQNDFDDGNLFWLSNNARIKLNKWKSYKECDLLDVEHSGFQRLKDPVTHHRIFLFNKKENYCVIVDNFYGKGNHRYDIFFHFRPIKIEFSTEDQFLGRCICEDGVNIYINPMNRDNLAVRLHTGWISPSYGVKKEAPILRMTKNGDVPQQFITLIYPIRENNCWTPERIKDGVYTFLSEQIKLI